ncbi:hypothetical protein [Halolamina sp. C58]|uniref:hypothetical protein n=1 Tax=Halolamina sp. C58 TaxID=3421640 RepID=UPI003EB8C7F9
MSETIADRVVLTVEPDDDGTVAALDSDRYRAFLRRAHAGPVGVGDEWAEFVSRGCGSTRDVTLRVAAVEGGEEVGAGTAFAFRRD